MEYALTFLIIGTIITMSYIISRQYARIQELTKTTDAYFEIYKDKGNSWRWRLRTQGSDSEIIASSNQGFELIEKVQDDISKIVETNTKTKIIIVKE